jgi:hypothetical protein
MALGTLSCKSNRFRKRVKEINEAKWRCDGNAVK